MKKIMLAAFALIIGFSFESIAQLKAHSVAPCQFWMPSSSGGFVCQNFPATILIPEAQSVANFLKEQNAKIAELEKRISELESICQKP